MNDNNYNLENTQHAPTPPNDNLNNRTQLYAIVENLFHMVRSNPIFLSTLLNYTTVDQIMQQSMRDIRKFIKHSTTHIHAHEEGAKKQATLNTNDISDQGSPTIPTDTKQESFTTTVGSFTNTV